ncbi:MAG: hypothetical protein NTV16_08145 [Actinobacteria bacterium]|nr:hypothetical protein [Actinomycetota bacterium]
MKKLIVIFIGLLMVTVIFVGCKTTVVKSETDTDVTIKTAETGTTVETTSVTTTAAETTTTAAETTTKANESASAGWTITISGINGKDVNFTDADAAKM